MAGTDQGAGAGDPFGVPLRDLFQREAGGLQTDGAMRFGQPQQRPVAARDHRVALGFLDRREGEVEMKQREQG